HCRAEIGPCGLLLGRCPARLASSRCWWLAGLDTVVAGLAADEGGQRGNPVFVARGSSGLVVSWGDSVRLTLVWHGRR
ncbi:hypothetical protein Droror1_Dr00000167, partial [Drosera rotundifolia]